MLGVASEHSLFLSVHAAYAVRFSLHAVQHTLESTALTLPH